ncbi:hypothetical protein P5008_01660 [Helcococcus ovis]
MKKNIKKIVAVVFACGLVFSSFNGVYAYDKFDNRIVPMGMVKTVLIYNEILPASTNSIYVFKRVQENGLYYEGYIKRGKKVDNTESTLHYYSGTLYLVSNPYEIGKYSNYIDK